MKKKTSIKTRITIWYSALMFILVSFVFSVVGALSYNMSIDKVEKNVILQVTQISDKLSKRQFDVFESVDNSEEFKNVTLYDSDGKYIAGQYIYDIVNVEFKDGELRRETVDGKEYIIYDVIKHGPPGTRVGFSIRGAESVESALLLGRSAFAIILIIIPLILILTAVGGYYITKKSFSPVNVIIKTANSISESNDISERIEINQNANHDELYDLSIVLNKMLDKIETLVNQEKQFASDASHELRTPISVILAQGEYLQEIATDEKEKELANSIVLKANQLTKLVSSLLLLSRIDQNRQKIKMEKIDLSEVVDISLGNASKLAKEKNTTVVLNVSDGIIVNADESLLISAVTNIICNGIKYGKQDGNLWISANVCNSKVNISIADDGVGISNNNIDKIWGRFYRIDDVRNDEYGSNGLGLAVVKSIIKLHGGEITVNSEEGNGSEFIITLDCEK